VFDDLTRDRARRGNLVRDVQVYLQVFTDRPKGGLKEAVCGSASVGILIADRRNAKGHFSRLLATFVSLAHVVLWAR
jgi:hypothetical protein